MALSHFQKKIKKKKKNPMFELCTLHLVKQVQISSRVVCVAAEKPLKVLLLFFHFHTMLNWVGYQFVLASWLRLLSVPLVCYCCLADEKVFFSIVQSCYCTTADST